MRVSIHVIVPALLLGLAAACGAVAGVGIGAGVGAMIKTERWVRVPLMDVCWGSGPPD